MARPRRGRRFIDAIYRHLGTVEIDDQAEGVKALWARPYVDRERVGIFGTSYGGYASLMCLLRHPEVGPDAGHSGVDPRRMMEFFIENLVINKPPPAKVPSVPQG